MTHTIPADETMLQQVREGIKSFHIFKTKKPVAVGDSLLFQTLTDEVMVPIQHIDGSDKITKGYTLVGWKAIEQGKRLVELREGGESSSA